MYHCSLQGNSTAGSKTALQGDNKTPQKSERPVLEKRVNKMKNNSAALKRHGQKRFLPAACPLDMTNKSPSHHQSRGMKCKTHSIDLDVFAPERETRSRYRDQAPTRTQESTLAQRGGNSWEYMQCLHTHTL